MSRHSEALSALKLRTFSKNGVSSTRTDAPSTEPSKLPVPPRMTMATIAVDWSKPNSVGEASWSWVTSIDPASPAMPAVTPNTVSL